MGGFDLALLVVNWLVLGNASCRLQGVNGALLKIPSIGTTYEDFDSFGMVYGAACLQCVCLFLTGGVCLVFIGDGGAWKWQETTINQVLKAMRPKLDTLKNFHF